MASFDNLSFDAASFDAAAADPGRFGINLPHILMPRPKLNTGLAWLSFPRYFGLREAVGGLVGTMQADTFYHGDRIESTNIAGGGIGWGWNTQLENISNRFSMLWYGQIDTLDTSSPLICIRASTGWKAINFNRNWTTSQLQCSTRGVSDGAEANSNSSTIATGEAMKLYAVTYVEGNFTFYVDGELINASLQTHHDIDWKDKLGVAVMGRRPDDIDGGLDGSYVMAAIYSRALTQGEIRTIALGPASVLEPTFAPIAVTPPAPLAPPVANFSVSPEIGTAPLTVQFTDSSTGTITSWAWDFQDNGSTDSTIQSPQFAFASAGTYTVRLTVTNSAGSSTITRQVQVNAPPVVVPVGGIQYTVEMDFARDGLFAHAQSAITSKVLQAQWSMGMNDALQEFASPSRMTLRLSNADGAWNPDDSGATYQGLLVPGVLARIRATHDGTTRTLWTGKVNAVSAAPGEFANGAGSWREVSVTAEDPMRALLASEYVPKLLLDVRTDQAIRALFDEGTFVYPYDKDFFRWDISRWDETRWYVDQISDLEEGYTVVPWAGDALDSGRGVSAQAYLREIVAAEGGGRFFWNGRTAKFTFHSRYHDAPGTLAATLGGTYLSGVRAAFGKDLANVITVQYEPRAVGADNSVLWEIEDDFTLRPGQERVITARYRDPDSKAKISALKVLAIQPGDLVANIQTQGKKSSKLDTTPVPLGADVSSQIAATVEGKADSAKVTVRNPLGVSVVISTLRLRGTPLTTFGRDEVTVSDADSIVDYDIHELMMPLRAIDDGEFAEAFARVHLARRKRALNRWETANVTSGYLMTDAYQATVQGHIVARTVGDRVRLIDTWSAHDAEYIIVGEQHRVDAARATHDVTWTLKPAQTETWFRWDVSVWDGPDVFVL